MNIQSSIKSDHRIIHISFQGDLFQKRGPNFWKFNSSLLGDEDYTTGINKLLKEVEVKYKDMDDKGLKWDIIKSEIREVSMRHSKAKARERRDIESDLLIKLNKLEALEDSGNLANPEDLVKVKMDLDEISMIKTRGAMVRSKANWAENGERSTKYFLGLGKRNYKTIVSLNLKELMVLQLWKQMEF